MFIIKKETEHAAVSIIEGYTRQTYLATVFPSSHYEPGELPKHSLEIKSQDEHLTLKNINSNLLAFLNNHFPETANFKINYYNNIGDYKNKKPLPIGQIAA